MKPLTQLYNVSPSTCIRVLWGTLCVSLLLMGGCAERRARAKSYPWDISANMHPVPPESAQTDDDADMAIADMPTSILSTITPPPSPLFLVRSVPARPRVPSGSPAPNEPATRADVLQIAPQLSAAETAAAQQQTNQSLSVAGHNLEATQGKKLNGPQSDLASKIRSFIAEAHDAAQNGDWTRARNVAKKAEVLSQELASSL